MSIFFLLLMISPRIWIKLDDKLTIEHQSICIELYGERIDPRLKSLKLNSTSYVLYLGWMGNGAKSNYRFSKSKKLKFTWKTEFISFRVYRLPFFVLKTFSHFSVATSKTLVTTRDVAILPFWSRHSASPFSVWQGTFQFSANQPWHF